VHEAELHALAEQVVEHTINQAAVSAVDGVEVAGVLVKESLGTIYGH
jgi:hypothetical protein